MLNAADVGADGNELQEHYYCASYVKQFELPKWNCLNFG